MPNIRTTTCGTCEMQFEFDYENTPPPAFCSRNCSEEWDAKTPGRWIAIEDLTVAQRAELDALLWCGKRGNN